MPRPGWNEIQDLALAYAARWAGETCEKGESQTSWGESLALCRLEHLSQAVLDARAQSLDAILADFYDPLTLAKAHESLDRAVDRLYRPELFESDSERVAFLFERYQALNGQGVQESASNER